MNLKDLKTLLTLHSHRLFQVQLPDGSPVPLSFHVTEVGRVHKAFIDCGGTQRESTTCQLQIWVGQDYEHRLETGKMAQILKKAESFFSSEDLPVEIEYEDEVISQYTVEGYQVREDAVVLKLAYKHTDCLAKELCGVAIGPTEREEVSIGCCGGGGCK
jgi:Family of unknown function (DUF6428)